MLYFPPECVCIERLPGVGDVSTAVLWIRRPEGGSQPLTSAPRKDFMTQSLVLQIDVCRRPPRTKHWLSFCHADLRPTAAQEISFRFFLNVWNFHEMICAHSERYINRTAGTFEVESVYGNIAFPMALVHKKLIVAKVVNEVRRLVWSRGRVEKWTGFVPWLIFSRISSVY